MQIIDPYRIGGFGDMFPTQPTFYVYRHDLYVSITSANDNFHTQVSTEVTLKPTPDISIKLKVRVVITID